MPAACCADFLARFSCSPLTALRVWIADAEVSLMEQIARFSELQELSLEIDSVNDRSFTSFRTVTTNTS